MSTHPHSRTLNGRAFKIVINGRRALNGKRHSVTLTGTVEVAAAEEKGTIYEVIRALADYAEAQNAEMELPDGVQITV